MVNYEEPVFRPPSEAASLLIQATIGCPHNRCSFCGMYKHKRYRVRLLAEIVDDLSLSRELYGPGVRSIFFPDGNTIARKTGDLEMMFRVSGELFPHVERMTIYGSAKFVLKKSLDDLARLRRAGLTRLHIGLESGDGAVLESVRKGFTPEDFVKAGKRLREAGIELSIYVMIGLAGRERSHEHAEASANVINEVEPDFIRLRTTVPIEGTSLAEDYRQGGFELLGPHEALLETRNLISRIDCRSKLFSDHVSNYWNLHGLLPDESSRMVAEIDHALTLDRSCFRPEVIACL